jgi:hypothetical protein
MLIWLQTHAASGVLVVEIGVGYQTPVVCRYPAEAIARQVISVLLLLPLIVTLCHLGHIETYILHTACVALVFLSFF